MSGEMAPVAEGKGDDMSFIASELSTTRCTSDYKGCDWVVGVKGGGR